MFECCEDRDARGYREFLASGDAHDQIGRVFHIGTQKRRLDYFW